MTVAMYAIDSGCINDLPREMLCNSLVEDKYNQNIIDMLVEDDYYLDSDADD